MPERLSPSTRERIPNSIAWFERRPSGFQGFEQHGAGKASLPRGGLDHGHDAGADGLGESIPGVDDGGQVGGG